MHGCRIRECRRYFTPAGIGTEVVRKRNPKFNGKEYLMEMASRQISRWLSMERRYDGNLLYKETQGILSADGNGRKSYIAEVELLVPVGELDPTIFHTPGIYVHRIFQDDYGKRIEQKTVRPKP